MILLSSCNNKREKQDVTEKFNSQVLKIEGLAKTNKEIPFWPENQLDLIKSEDWIKAKTGRSICNGGIVFVDGVDGKFAEIITLTGKKGYVHKKYLTSIELPVQQDPFFGPGELIRINTNLPEGDVQEVNLWNHYSKRDELVVSLFNHEEAVLLDEYEQYVKLGTYDGKVGWCLKDYIKK